jgi:hypothetical protein
LSLGDGQVPYPLAAVTKHRFTDKPMGIRVSK